MRKIILTLFLAGLAFSFCFLSYSVNAQVRMGSRSDEVKAIQEILKSDSKIYPEGYVTGYFGLLTEKAVKKLQEKCGLPQTGIVDENTQQCVFPVFEVKVLSPNGGEVWDKNQIQTIKWDISVPSGQEIKEENYVQPRASIDLFRKVVIATPCPSGQTCENVENSVFVRHIATVNLFDRAYSWNITNDIGNSKDYVIRISVGGGIIPAILGKGVLKSEEIWPISPKPTWIKWDESDGTFEITGEVKPTVPNTDEIIKILENIIEEIQRAITLLKGS